MVLNIIDTLILVDVNFLLSLMQLSNTNSTKTWLIHILVLVPILSVGVWFMGMSLVKSDMCKYLHHALFKRREQRFAPSREQVCEERQSSPQNASVQEVHPYESNEEREPLIGIVDDN